MVYLTYQESKKSKASPKDDFATIDVCSRLPPGLQVSVTPVGGGQPLPIEMGLATNTSTKKGQSRDAIGSVEIAAPGTYTVTAGPEFPDAVESQILLGS